MSAARVMSDRKIRRLAVVEGGKLVGVITENDIKPIVQPKVSVESQDPLTLTMTFVEKPEVALKGIEKLKGYPVYSLLKY